MKRALRKLAALVFCGAASFAFASEDDHHDQESDTAGHDRESRFEVEDFAPFGVTIATAGPGDVDRVLELPAEVRPNADRLSHLAAPFPGIVRAVHKTVGDPVRAGELLAVIESETLVSYPLKAGFDGVVIDKHVTPGETVTRDHRLFIVADLSTVWVEVDVYLDALPLVQTGDAVRLEAARGQLSAEGRVSYIAPIIDEATRTAKARVVLANADGQWRPGLFVTALVTRPLPAAVTVSRRALHNLEGRTVVFTVENDRFEVRPVVVGVTGAATAAIESGLVAGERFADEGSFLVKAELLKGDAGHDH